MKLKILVNVARIVEPDNPRSSVYKLEKGEIRDDLPTKLFQQLLDMSRAEMVIGVDVPTSLEQVDAPTDTNSPPKRRGRPAKDK